MAAIGQIMTALSTNQKTGLLKILKMRYINDNVSGRNMFWVLY